MSKKTTLDIHRIAAKDERVIVKPADVNPKEVDALIASEFYQLSCQDRERVLADLHGIATDKQEEDETSMEQTLQKMQIQIDKIVHKPAYDEAEALGSEYIHDRTFRVKFVRAERYHAEKAAVRMVKFLELCRDLYGSETLLRPIQWTDLSPNAVSIMVKEGPLQVLPVRDSVGRRIILMLKDIGPSYPVIDRQRMSLYLWQTVSDDEMTQKLGLVFVVYVYNCLVNVHDEEDKRSIDRITQCIPLRNASVHLCMPDTPIYHAIKATNQLLMGRENRSRNRLHCGSPTECLYSLKAFGLPSDYFPTSVDNENGTDGTSRNGGYNYNHKNTMKNHRKWCKMRKSIEQQIRLDANFQNSIVECPFREDFLVGKGAPNMKNPGNVALRKLLKERLERFDAAPRAQKSVLASEVVDIVRLGGGRFLKEDPNGWYVELDEESARRKVSTAFRDASRSMKEMNARNKKEQKTQTQEEEQQHEASVHGIDGPAVTVSSSSGIQTLNSDTSNFLALSDSVSPFKRRKLLNDDEDCVKRMF